MSARVTVQRSAAADRPRALFACLTITLSTLLVPAPALADQLESATVTGAETFTSYTLVDAAVTGLSDTSYYTTLYAAATCPELGAPETTLVYQQPVVTDATGATATQFLLHTALVPGTVVGVGLASVEGEADVLLSPCATVTGTHDPTIAAPNMIGAWIMEPARTAIHLDYTIPEDPTPSCLATLDPSSVPDPGDFAVTLNLTTAIAVDSVVVDSDDGCPQFAELHFTSAVPHGAIRVDYVPGATPLRTQVGHPAPAFTGELAQERARGAVLAPSSITTDGDGDGATAEDPLETTVHPGVSGPVDIRELVDVGAVAGGSHTVWTIFARVDAPSSSPSAPTTLEFVIDPGRLIDPATGSNVPIEEVEVLNGLDAIPPCDPGSGGTASPDPCMSDRSMQADGLHIVVLTSQASGTYGFGFDLPPLFIAVANPILPTWNHAVLFFIEPLDLGSLAAPADFTVTADGTPLTVTDVDLLMSGLENSPINQLLPPMSGGTFLEVRWAESVPSHATVEIEYTPGADPLRDRAGNEIAATTFVVERFGEPLVLPFVDEGPGPDQLIIFAATSLQTPLPAPGDFLVTVLLNDGGTEPLTPTALVQRYPHLGYGLLALTLPRSLVPGEGATLSYTPGVNPLTYGDGTPVGALTDAEVYVSVAHDSPRATEPDPGGGPVVVSPPDSSTGGPVATITFPQVTGAGTTTVRSDIETSAPPIPTNFGLGDPPQLFEITTTATFVPPAEVCLVYNAGAYADETQVSLLHFEGGLWMDVTTSLDTDANVVCGLVDSFSPFAIAESTGPDYDFTGLLWPVKQPPRVNHVRAGWVVPVRFGLGGDHGLDIFATGSPSSERVTCPRHTGEAEMGEQESANALTLRYNARTDRYIYAWRTQRAWAGTCRLFTMELADGSVATALFRFWR